MKYAEKGKAVEAIKLEDNVKSQKEAIDFCLGRRGCGCDVMVPVRDNHNNFTEQLCHTGSYILKHLKNDCYSFEIMKSEEFESKYE
ncbi:hypothetical protein AAEX28_02385 [Lentisphaerota bacterium WC36G]|nr:hypothetical protein LJT99_05270 [Lentisphaerae bacterium WC36]